MAALTRQDDTEVDGIVGKESALQNVHMPFWLKHHQVTILIKTLNQVTLCNMADTAKNTHVILLSCECFGNKKLLSVYTIPKSIVSMF